jgi:hypothetical protein
MDEYKSDNVNQVRTMQGRYGTYILASDLQKFLLQDALQAERAGEEFTSKYIEHIAGVIGKVK